MDDLISRTAAIEICKSIVPNTNPDFYNLRSKAGYGSWMHSNGEVCAITNIETKIEALPAVNAAPVVHGRWLGRRYDFKEYKYVIVPYDATTFDNPDDLFCSVCNEPALSDGAENDVPSNYCPNCGAKMDGERRESE